VDNTPVDPHGKCKISDLKEVEDIYKNQAMMGFIFRMALEVLTNNHEEYSAKIDIGSGLCCIEDVD